MHGMMEYPPVFYPDMERHGPGAYGGIDPLLAGLLGAGIGFLGGSLITGPPGYGPGAYPGPGYPGPGFNPWYGPYSGFGPYPGYGPGFRPYGY